ncbi:hypothetical protein [Aeromicrobium erythreum]|uniref:PsbP C-terminal domain-containing protein n=1 Tax=Aeromicrobium erythreum TaxID=2041 RepID=A0A0U4CD58_9ACTN|nr:hypothetical protein [Aeromicrobium erythreum]ALX03365.1 hypothetical protein AERYTH_00940 [Aeromicrobium erythreum]
MRLLDRAPVRALLVAATATVVLTACGGTDSDSSGPSSSSASSSTDGGDSSAPAPTAKPADGDRVEADGFSYAVPEGWKENKNGAGAALSLAIDVTDKDGFADNVNVVSDPTIVNVKGKQLEDALVKVLKNANAQEIEVRDPLTIDGQEAVHTTALFNLNGNEYRVEQYTLAVDGKGYVITFSHNKDLSEADRDAVDQSILASWSWA